MHASDTNTHMQNYVCTWTHVKLLPRVKFDSILCHLKAISQYI